MEVAHYAQMGTQINIVLYNKKLKVMKKKGLKLQHAYNEFPFEIPSINRNPKTGISWKILLIKKSNCYHNFLIVITNILRI